MLALVQVLVRLTRAPDMQSLVRAITGRIGALARAHALLSESRWNGADLQRLVSEELAPFRASDRAHASGPTVALAAGAAQSVAMVLHELATNAAKYGALSRLTGRIDLTWAWDAGILVLRWSENGGPPVQQPTSFGLGTGVIERNVVQQLDGTVRFEWRLEGFACEIRLPGRALVVSRAAA
jgi:two-component sensor histidine kinase